MKMSYALLIIYFSSYMTSITMKDVWVVTVRKLGNMSATCVAVEVHLLNNVIRVYNDIWVMTKAYMILLAVVDIRTVAIPVTH